MLKLRKTLLFNYLYYLIFLLAIIIFIIITIMIKRTSILDINSNYFKGIITDYKIDGNTLTFILKDKEKIKSTYYFKTKEEKEYYLKNIKYGLNLKIEGTLKIPLNNTIPNTFNYKKYLSNHNIYYLLEVEKIDISNKKINVFYQLKNLVNNYLLKFNNYDYLITFVLGNKNYLDNEIISNYQSLGVSHLFAISGMHITLFSTCLLFLLKKINIAENKRYIIVMLFLLFYTFLTNFTPSVLRASLFFLLLSVNKIFYTNIKTINIYLLTISILIFINPFILYDLGAQYSFLTSLGLILFSDKLNNKNYIITLFKVSLIAFLFSLPVTAINFYEINLLTIFNNLIFVPLISLLIYPLSLIILFLPFLEFILTILIIILEKLSVFFSQFKIEFLIPKTSFVLWIVYYLIILLYLKNNKIVNLLLIAFLLIFNRYKYILDNNYYIYYLDVGQGDSNLLISPKLKEIILIDTGGKLEYQKEKWEIKNSNYKLSNNTIIFLKSLGINKIDLLLITHGDEDHIGEALNILNNIKVDNIILNKNKYNYLEKEILKTNKVINNYQSKYFNYKILNTKIYNDENKDSLITYFNIYNKYFLFMGDSYQEQELDLINRYQLKVDIIKLGHHGSKTSSNYNFLKTINPTIAIISSGRNNKFNHPSKETIDNLNKLDIKYYNTQCHGTIKIKISTNDLYYYFYLP